MDSQLSLQELEQLVHPHCDCSRLNAFVRSLKARYRTGAVLGILYGVTVPEKIVQDLPGLKLSLRFWIMKGYPSIDQHWC